MTIAGRVIPTWVPLVGGGVALFLLLRRSSKPAATTPTAQQELSYLGYLNSTGAGAQEQATTDAAAGLTEQLTKILTDQFGQIGGLLSATGTGLATGIHGDMTQLAAAQDTGFKGIKDALTAAIQTVKDALTAGSQQQTAALQSVQQAADAANKSLIDQLTQGVTTLTKAIGDAATAATSRADAADRLAYLGLGMQSVATCVRADGSVDATCVKTHAADLPTGGYPASNVPGLVAGLYPACRKGNLYDLVCVGKVMAGGGTTVQ